MPVGRLILNAPCQQNVCAISTEYQNAFSVYKVTGSVAQSLLSDTCTYLCGLHLGVMTELMFRMTRTYTDWTDNTALSNPGVACPH